MNENIQWNSFQSPNGTWRSAEICLLPVRIVFTEEWRWQCPSILQQHTLSQVDTLTSTPQFLPKSEWPKHFGDCDVLYTAVDHKLYSIHMFIHNVGRAIDVPGWRAIEFNFHQLSILTVGCVRVCVCVRTYMTETETEVACTHSRMYFDVWPVNVKIRRGETRVYGIEMMLALSSE